MLIHSSCRVDPISPQVNFSFYFVLFCLPCTMTMKSYFIWSLQNFMTTNPLLFCLYVMFSCTYCLAILFSYTVEPKIICIKCYFMYLCSCYSDPVHSLATAILETCGTNAFHYSIRCYECTLPCTGLYT